VAYIQNIFPSIYNKKKTDPVHLFIYFFTSKTFTMSANEETKPKVEKKPKAPKAPKSKEGASPYPLEVPILEI
jgi:hypothetical protein